MHLVPQRQASASHGPSAKAHNSPQKGLYDEQDSKRSDWSCDSRSAWRSNAWLNRRPGASRGLQGSRDTANRDHHPHKGGLVRHRRYG